MSLCRFGLLLRLGSFPKVFQKRVGNGVLSHEAALAVPSALVTLTAGFEMVPGVPSPLLSPTHFFAHSYYLSSEVPRKQPASLTSPSTLNVPPASSFLACFRCSLTFRVPLVYSRFTSTESFHSQVPQFLIHTTPLLALYFSRSQVWFLLSWLVRFVPPQASALRHHISKPSTISTGLLHMLPRFHTPPISLVVS